MTVWASLRTHLSTWIDDVAAGLTLLGAMLRRSHRVELVEQADGSFLVVDMRKQPADWPSLRIDDPDGGWKGRGLWSTYAGRAPYHIEGGKGTTSKVVHFQLRPDPLAR